MKNDSTDCQMIKMIYVYLTTTTCCHANTVCKQVSIGFFNHAVYDHNPSFTLTK